MLQSPYPNDLPQEITNRHLSHFLIEVLNFDIAN